MNVTAPVGLGTGFRGSGVIVSTDPETGTAYILTAYHVVDETPKGIIVNIAGEPGTRNHSAEIVAHDPWKDIALLSACCSPWFLAAKMSDHSPVLYPEQGDAVYAVAYGANGRVEASWGEVLGSTVAEIGADVDVEPGYSGGALVTAKTYEVLGIITGTVSYEDGYTPVPEALQAFGLGWPPGTAVAVQWKAIVDELGVGEVMGLPPTPTPTPSPTPTPPPTPTPQHSLS